MHDVIEQFAGAIRSAGLTPPDVIEQDGKLHRFSGNGKAGDDAGYYVLHGDGIPAGHFGDWRTGLSQDWRADIGRDLTPAEIAVQRAKIENIQREREAEKARQHAAAASRAVLTYQPAQPGPDDHPYLIRKGIKPNGARLHDDALMIPMRDAEGVLHSLQFIGPDGDKRFLAGGRVTGCYFSIGKPADRICIAEGFATGASIHEATGHAVAVAFNAGNLLAVAQALQAKYPAATLIICADDDHQSAGNPGLTKATKAALAVNGLLAVPEFGADRPAGATDFNDMMQQHGAGAVGRAVAGARRPPNGDDQPGGEHAAGRDADGTPWPQTMDDAALHGIAGEFVRMVEPNTEADPAALLVQFLVCFGALVGRGPHYQVEGDQHHSNLFALLVGATAKARKGTAMGRVREVFTRIRHDDPGKSWKPHVSGLSSGEGIKYNVRDAREGVKTDKAGIQTCEVIDEGIMDKRLLIIEPEFASALRAAQRSGSTLSATIRESWDSGNLQTLTKNDPITATGAHICIVGHITDDELRAELTATDSANGFANRFLFVAVRRSKLLPFGGDDADDGEIEAFAIRLRELAEAARTRQRIKMTDTARTVWTKVYPELSAGSGGLHGAVTARAEAQVIRLALVYTLLDGNDQIDVPHLLAGLAIWNYCNDTARHIFGASLGDRTADEILRRLQLAGDGGLTRTEISNIFKRNVSADRIGAALELLCRKGRAKVETITGEGRPVEVWRITK